MAEVRVPTWRQGPPFPIPLLLRTTAVSLISAQPIGTKADNPLQREAWLSTLIFSFSV